MADNPAVPESSFTVFNETLNLLAPTAKRGCSNCGGDAFATEDVTSNAGATEGIYYQCLSCGLIERITLSAMGATQDYS